MTEAQCLVHKNMAETLRVEEGEFLYAKVDMK